MNTTDLLNLFLQIRRGFKTAGLEVPKAIELKSSKDGAQFMKSLVDTDQYSVSPEILTTRPIKGPDGKLWIELAKPILGIAVRWPTT